MHDSASMLPLVCRVSRSGEDRTRRVWDCSGHSRTRSKKGITAPSAPIGGERKTASLLIVVGAEYGVSTTSGEVALRLLTAAIDCGAASSGKRWLSSGTSRMGCPATATLSGVWSAYRPAEVLSTRPIVRRTRDVFACSRVTSRRRFSVSLLRKCLSTICCPRASIHVALRATRFARIRACLQPDSSWLKKFD